MPTPNTPSATPIQQAGRSSRGVPHGTIDQSLFWKDVRQAVLFVAAFVVVGGGAVIFLIQPRHVQAMLVYVLIVTGCVALIAAGLRRKARDR